MRVDYAVALEVASHEAIIRQAYRDSVGKWTWSVGLTNATGHNVERYIDNPQPLQHCLDIYVWALTNYAEQVKEVFAGVDLTQAQFAAAVSFHWNTGAIRRASWVKKFLAGDVAGARRAIMNWVTPPEITERRKKERSLFFDGVWSNNGEMLEFTRLTSRSTPDWSSGRYVNVEAELRAAFAKEPPAPDHAPQPDAPVEVPTISPEGMDTPIQPSDVPRPEPRPTAPETASEAPQEGGSALRGIATGAAIGAVLTALRKPIGRWIKWTANSLKNGSPIKKVLAVGGLLAAVVVVVAVILWVG